MQTFDVPCDRCGEKSAAFKAQGFTVFGCAPHPNKPGMCTLSYDLSQAGIETATPAAASAEEEPSPTPTQAATAKAIVNIFETGQVLGNYGAVTVLEHDRGRLTYGRSQTSLASGNLHDLLQRYCAADGARYAPRLNPLLPAFAAQEKDLDSNLALHNLLRAAADDRVMRDTQDAFFDLKYWDPSLATARQLGLGSALAVAVIYDSRVHGSLATIRDMTTQQVGPPAQVGEKRWITQYVEQRRTWLATHDNELLHATVYRMDAFKSLINQGVWNLSLPLVVRGQEISLASLSGTPPGCFDGPQPGSRALALATPMPRGLDVRLVQLGLSDHGMNIVADGVFGKASSDRIKEFQIAQGHAPTGVADPALIRLITE